MADARPERLTVMTGATSGIGRAIARALAADGHHLLTISRGGEGLDTTRRDLDEIGGRDTCIPVVADLERDAARGTIALAARADGRPIGLIVHCAGVAELGPFDADAVGRFDRQLAVNARAPLALTVDLLPLMADGAGHIVFVNSTAGLRANALWGAYAASKYALRAIADSLRDELRPRGIRVTSLFPGRTDSPMQRAVHEAEGKPYAAERLLTPDDVAAVLRTVIGLPPTAEVSDVTVRPTPP
ncbi:SDR family oxidoreductase [soil metagenome]|nr:SDR family NAD(P)-dependent oxidoreductase [Trueperaceae bacterium]